MTTTEREEPVLLTSHGHLCCDFCDARYDYALVQGSALTPRQQLRQAASRAGWKQTTTDLEVCPADGKSFAAILIQGWAMLWTPESALPERAGPPVMCGDDEQTATIPAVVEDAA